MKKSNSKLLGLLLLLVTLKVTAANCDDPRPLRLAFIPKTNTETQLAQYRPLIQLLENTLERRIAIVPTTSYGTVIEGLLAGAIDLAELGPASYAIAKNRGAKITTFATFSMRKGLNTDAASAYRSLLIVRSDKNLNNIAKLQGKTLSLTDPASTSGALLPRQAVKQLTGMQIESFFQRVTFAGSHDRAIEAVQKRLVDAAFVSSARLDEALRRGTIRSDEIRILWQSGPIPYDPIVLSERLCPELANNIKQVFLGDTRTLAVMFRELDINGFVPASDEQYRDFRTLFSAQE